ncbi:MAG: NlpC/P60 family protein [Bacteroidia bacterium]
MKRYILLLLVLIPLLLSAQSKKQKKRKAKTKAKAEKMAMVQYYSNYALKPDSAVTPYLYYQVYDWVGTHYKYSGENKKGIDCSGFVAEMYKCAYCVELAGGSADIWKKVTPVEKNELQEGDIVFFKIKKGRISHVGIYLGNNKFAHASVKGGVMINDLDETYYKNTFYKGGRIFWNNDL